MVAPNRHDLRQVPEKYLVDAMDRLPPCRPDSTVQQLQIEVPFAGQFMVTFEPRTQVIRGHPSSRFWIPTLAARLTAAWHPGSTVTISEGLVTDPVQPRVDGLLTGDTW